MKLSTNNLLQTYFILNQIIVGLQVTEGNFIRSFFFGDEQNNDAKSIARELDWNFADTEFEDDKFFSNYDADEVPEDKSVQGDRIDYLRDGDVCVGSDGSLSRDNCLEPPDCSHSSEEIGQAMLCINRAAVPGDTTSWYVVAMKCIPVWENCDKCYCGYMKRSYAEDGFCRWDDSTANDDRVEYDCDDRSKVEMMGRSYTFGEGLSSSGMGDKSDKGDKGGKDEDEDDDDYDDNEYDDDENNEGGKGDKTDKGDKGEKDEDEDDDDYDDNEYDDDETNEGGKGDKTDKGDNGGKDEDDEEGDDDYDDVEYDDEDDDGENDDEGDDDYDDDADDDDADDDAEYDDDDEGDDSEGDRRRMMVKKQENKVPVGKGVGGVRRSKGIRHR